MEGTLFLQRKQNPNPNPNPHIGLRENSVSSMFALVSNEFWALRHVIYQPGAEGLEAACVS